MGKCRKQLTMVVLFNFFFLFSLLYLYSQFLVGKNPITLFGNSFGDSDHLQESNLVHVHGNLHEPSTLNQTNDGEARDINMNVTTTEPTNIGSRNWDTGTAKNVFQAEDDGFESVHQISVSEKELEPDNNQAHPGDNEVQFVEASSSENGEESETIEVAPNVNANKEAPTLTKQSSRDNKGGVVESDVVDHSCSGRYVYVHDLPKKFNDDLLKNCRSLNNWTNMCEFTSNLGLGPRLQNFVKVYSKYGWFATNQFLLEVIFHNRMKQYNCLTKNSTLASAIFVPYYAGLDVARYLWGSNTTMRDSGSLQLVKWLREKPEWKKTWGRDHFMVAGRITWDFRRTTDEDFDWGSKLMFLPESRNMTILTIESSPWHNNDFAIPYPTYFHPSKDIEVFQWQSRMRRQKRRFLFSFAGGSRPNLQDSIRSEIIGQCQASRRKCKLLDCDSQSNKCYKPVFVMKMFQSSVFCLQPPGDSYTRRSAFDSILAGCIPVFFHPGSAYVQYLWHLPKDHTKYSVFIPAFDIKKGNVSIERILHRIPKQKTRAMREEVISLIPKVIYADPSCRLQTLDDAFDIAVKGVLEKVSRVEKEMRECRNSSLDYIEELSWKYNLLGTVQKEHEWDPFFART